MSESTSQAGGDGFDLSQFYQVFFEEAGENLELMEQQLLGLDVGAPDDESLNSIFRCAHSVKGGAATFGFKDVAELTHHMETLLDKLRRHELALAAPMVDVLLQAGDALKALLARHRQGGEGEAVDPTGLLESIRAMAHGGSAPAGAAPTAARPAAAVAATSSPAAGAPGTPRMLELRVGPLDNPATAAGIVELFAEIQGLGTIEPIDGGEAADGMRRFKVSTESSDDDLVELFSFHVAREQVQLLPFGPGYGFHAGAPGAPAVDGDGEFGFFDSAPGAPAPGVAAVAPAVPRADVRTGHHAPAAPVAEATTLRVPVERVDQLINLVGELVITQAMLAQTGAKVDSGLYRQLAAGLADLSRNTRNLQEAVMSIRMIPMSVVFNRFPRMLRDLAAKLDKKVEFVTEGEATELDKGLVEKITDPLTHLVRNSCDHGIELPAERRARGKAEAGTVTLTASHQGGSIVIEVRDDGKGLSRPKLLAKARERGIDAPDSMADGEVWNLIFAPGFSTAEVVTDVSGRGVGMDVVMKNITALGGTVEIESAEGWGMAVRVRLPLTLAIMDGMSVAVGSECYILPLSSVVESFQVGPDTIRTIGGSGRVVQVRGEYLPVVALEEVFEVPRFGQGGGAVVVVVEAEGHRAALLVDELLGQQQVVVKNLEANYRRVAGVSGATILGDGHVALILDAGALARRARH
ncbi:MAG: chemotaxis protein CheW [Caldimonas sp.]